MKNNGLYITKPVPASNTYHVFSDHDHRSLCGKYGMIRINKELTELVTGQEEWVKGQDCKTCFKKANLNVKK